MQTTIQRILEYGGTAILGAALAAVFTGSTLSACPGPQAPGSRSNLAALRVRAMARMAKIAAPRLNAAEAAGDVDPNGAVVGMWHVTSTLGDETDEAYEQFFADGNELAIDTTPPSEDNVCNGVWVQTGTLVYKVKHPSFAFDGNGALVGTVMIRSVITLDRGGASFTGTQTVDVFDNNGSLMQHFEGILLKGTRIKPD